MSRAWKEREIHIEFLQESHKERNHQVDLDVDERIV
jgi:hypothetical protein